MVDEIMFLDLPREEREQVMRDNCDQIIERSYTKKFDQEEINARRAEYADVGIQVAELEKQLAEIRAFTETYDRFGINDPQAGWTPAKLGQFIRLNRGVFEERQECMKLVSQLKNFTAKAKAEIQKQRDPSGSTADVYRQEVESNLPKSFTVNLAIFKGTAKQSIEVEFDHYLKDGEVFLQLVSPGANELTETYRDQCIDDVLDKIREVAPDIAILEV
jgi:vacuolar-type H+-ATPase subunit I/STV1